MYRRNLILMSALESVLSAGAAAVAAVEREGVKLYDEIKSLFGLRHAVTGQVNEFHSKDDAHNFLRNVDPDDAQHWQTASGFAPAALPASLTGDGQVNAATAGSTSVEVDLNQLRADVASNAGMDQANDASADAAAAPQPGDTGAAAATGDTGTAAA